MPKPLRDLFKPQRRRQPFRPSKPRQDQEPPDEATVEPLPRNQLREVPGSEELSALAMSELAESSPRGQTGQPLRIPADYLNALLNT